MPVEIVAKLGKRSLKKLNSTAERKTCTMTIKLFVGGGDQNKSNGRQGNKRQ